LFLSEEVLFDGADTGFLVFDELGLGDVLACVAGGWWRGGGAGWWAAREWWKRYGGRRRWESLMGALARIGGR